MDKTLKSESYSFSGIVPGLYRIPTFLKNCHYGTGNASLQTLTSRNFQIHCYHMSKISTYLIQSKNIILFIHLFKHNFSGPTLYQTGANVPWYLKFEHLQISHWPAHHNTCFQTNVLAFLSDFFFFNTRKKISMLECNCKVVQKKIIPSIHTRNDFPNSTNRAYEASIKA